MEYKNYETIIFPVSPFPKPRMTQRDRWKKRPVVVKYHIYKDSMNHYANEYNYCVDNVLSLTFIIPFPKSYSKKKKQELRGKPHILRPDLDNLLKAFKDALCKEDSYVHTYETIKKIWGDEGQIVVKKLKPIINDTTIEQH